jgi:uncharacterized protein YkwD
MNWIDIILLAVFSLALLAGWYRGFILGSLDLLSWAGSLALGYIFYGHMSNLLDHFLELGVWLLPISFILTTIIARVFIGIIVRLLIRVIPQEARFNPVNRLLGIIPGAVNGWLYSIILSALLLSMPLKDSITEASRNSRFVGKLAMQSEWANNKLAPVFNDAIRQTINTLTVHPSSDETVSLPFKYDAAVERPNFEAQMLVLVNKERTSRGLKPLQPDPEMTMVARAHSRDMFLKGYFAHVNLEGQDPFDRMKAAGVSFRSAGENLALAKTVEMAHQNLMNSPGHRANILQPAYGRLGIGILDGGYYGLMIRQEFRN